MDPARGRGADLGVVEVLRVLRDLVRDRRVVRARVELVRCGQRPGVGLHLQVTLVHPPVSGIHHEGDDDDKHRHPEGDHHQDTAALHHRIEPHAHPAV